MTKKRRSEEDRAGGSILHGGEAGKLGFAHDVVLFELPAQLSPQLFRFFSRIVFDQDLDE